MDVEEQLIFGELLKVGLELLDACAALADDDARARGVNDHLGLVGGSLHLDVGDAGVGELLTNRGLQLQILVKPLRVVLVLVPLGLPRLHDAETETIRMYFLTHGFSFLPRR